MFYNQVKEGLISYVQNEIIHKAEGHMKFVLYTAVALMVPKLDEMYHQYKKHPVIEALGLISENDEIDVGALYQAMKDAMHKLGKVEFMGIIFNASDVETLYKYIIQAD